MVNKSISYKLLLFSLLICVFESCTNALIPHYIRKKFNNHTASNYNLNDNLININNGSLTIIVTFKDNISQKQQAPVPSTKQKDIPATNETTTGIELLFTSKHYKRIVGVFTWASFIL